MHTLFTWLPSSNANMNRLQQKKRTYILNKNPFLILAEGKKAHHIINNLSLLFVVLTFSFRKTVLHAEGATHTKQKKSKERTNSIRIFAGVRTRNEYNKTEKANDFLHQVKIVLVGSGGRVWDSNICTIYLSALVAT